MLRKKLAVWAVLSSPLGLVSCGGDPVDKAAKDACACLKPMYEKMNAVSEAMKGGDLSKLAQMKEGMEENKACFAKLESDYPEINKNKELQEKVSARIEELCPAPKMFGSNN